MERSVTAVYRNVAARLDFAADYLGGKLIYEFFLQQSFYRAGTVSNVIPLGSKVFQCCRGKLKMHPFLFQHILYLFYLQHKYAADIF